MSRIIVTSPFPGVPSYLPDGARLITPHRPAADVLKRPEQSLQSLARKLLAKAGLHPADPRVAARLLREAVGEVLPRASASAAAKRFDSVLKTVLRVGIDTDELKRLGSRRAGELAAVAEAYKHKLRQKDLVDAVELVWQAANLPDPEWEVLFIYGYARARKEEIAFIDRIAADGSVYYLPVADESDAFRINQYSALELAGRGWVLQNDHLPPLTVGDRAAAKFAGLSQDVLEDVAACSFQDIGAEVRFALGSVKKLLRGGTRAGDIAIVARDLNLYAKEFALVGAEYGVPTRSTLQIPLGETLVGGLVNLLLSVVERDFAFEDTIRLLGHPFGPGMCEETWQSARRNRTERYDPWLALERSLCCLEDLRAGAPRSYAEWVKCLRAALTEFNVRARAGHLAREVVAFNRLGEELSFAASDEAAVLFPEFAMAVRDILSNVTTNFDPSRLGVLITEPNMIAGGRFRHLFVLGLAEGVLPALPVDNPVIDFHERKALAKEGLDFEEAADVPRWEALSFFSLLSTATESLTLITPKTIGREEKLVSPYFSMLGLDPAPAEPDTVCSAVELLRNSLRKGSCSHEAALRRLAVERTRESSAPCGEYDGVIGEAVDVAGRTWSVSQLGTLAGCGFRWFAGYALRLRPADEMEIEVSPAARGKLFHQALHIAASGGARSRAEILDRLDEAMRAAYEDPDVGMPRLQNWELVRSEYISTLKRAVAAEDFAPDGSEIVATEKDFAVTLHGLKVRGRIDRIDRTPNGLMAVDYKTGKGKPEPIRDREMRKVDLQLAVYRAALSALYPGEAVGGGVYYSLTACKKFDAEAPDEALLNEFLHAVLEAPRTGALAVSPVSANTCMYCEYDQLCRKGSRLQRKEAAV